MAEPTPPPSPAARISAFLDKHSGFLSSFVLGLAGLIATSWQYRQSQNAKTEADTQRELAEKKAENDWKIARAEILAKNLDVLASQTPGSADRKYGVLDLLLGPRAEVGRAVNHMHGRILWCQMDALDLALLRDRVIVPAAERALSGAGAPDPTIREDMIGLLALVPVPTEAKALARFDAALKSARADGAMAKLLEARQARAARQRSNPPPMIRRVNFCGAPAPPEDDDAQ